MYRLYLFIAVCPFFVTQSLLSQTETVLYPTKMVITVPVADLRFEPQAHDVDLKLPTSDLTNPLQVTQLLLGDYIIARREYIDANAVKWLQVDVLQQERFLVPYGWHGYPGWIQAHQAMHVEDFHQYNLVIKNQWADVLDECGSCMMHLSIGTKILAYESSCVHQGSHKKCWKFILPDQRVGYVSDSDVYEIVPVVQETEHDVRHNIMDTSMTFLGNFYSWGGRSAQMHNLDISSVDCSAMINLSFLAHGFQIPRMSREQFLDCDAIMDGTDLQPGDLIFFASIHKHPFRIDHIMLYLGNEQLIEATFAGEHKVRVLSFVDRVGQDRLDVKSGDIIDSQSDQYHIYFGTFFKKLQKLRDNALRYNYEIA